MLMNIKATDDCVDSDSRWMCCGLAEACIEQLPPTPLQRRVPSPAEYVLADWVFNGECPVRTVIPMVCRSVHNLRLDPSAIICWPSWFLGPDSSIVVQPEAPVQHEPLRDDGTNLRVAKNNGITEGTIAEGLDRKPAALVCHDYTGVKNNDARSEDGRLAASAAKADASNNHVQVSHWPLLYSTMRIPLGMLGYLRCSRLTRSGRGDVSD